MSIKYDPTLKKEVNKISMPFAVLIFLVIVITYIILRIFFSSDYFQLLIFYMIIVLILFFSIIFFIRKKIWMKIPENEIEEIKKKSKEFQKIRYFYLTLSIIPFIIGFLITIYALKESIDAFMNVIPITLLLVSLTPIIIGLDYRNNMEYYKQIMYKFHGENAELEIRKISNLLIYNGIALIFVAILLFILSTYILQW